jgi:hypothetical protein
MTDRLDRVEALVVATAEQQAKHVREIDALLEVASNHEVALNQLEQQALRADERGAAIDRRLATLANQLEQQALRADERGVAIDQRLAVTADIATDAAIRSRHNSQILENLLGDLRADRQRFDAALQADRQRFETTWNAQQEVLQTLLVELARTNQRVSRLEEST